MCSQTMALTHNLLEFAGRPRSKERDNIGFFFFAKFVFVLHKLQETERERLLKSSSFLSLQATPQSVSTVQTIPQ